MFINKTALSIQAKVKEMHIKVKRNEVLQVNQACYSFSYFVF